MEITVVQFMQIFVTIVVAFITAYFTNLNENKKQITVFFKKEGVKIQQEMLDFWSSIFFDDYSNAIKIYIENNMDTIMKNNNLNSVEEISEVMAMKEIQKNSYMYSSKATLKYIGYYMQEIFKNRKKSKILLQIFFVSKIINNMKYDFTGEKTTAMDLLKIKINDLKMRQKIKIYYYEIRYLYIRI